jgi:hypothetical protein
VYRFDEGTLYETHRGPLRTLRQFLRPILKLFFNPDKITSAFHVQLAVNAQAEARIRRLEERELLSYELLHNLTVEITRLGIEVQNLRMRLESVSSRLDFDERRGRSLEGVVQYRPDALQQRPEEAAGQAPGAPAAPRDGRPPESGAGAGTEAGERRRRRRRRRRRPGQTLADRPDPGAARNGRTEGAGDGASTDRSAGGGQAPPADGDGAADDEPFENGPDEADADDR